MHGITLQLNEPESTVGTPSNDADRWDRLITLCNEAMKQLETSNAVVFTYSTLRRRCRNVLCVASYEYLTVQIHFVHFKVGEEHIKARIKARVGRYMKARVVQNQMEALEEPAQDELDVVKVDVQQEKDVVCNDALAKTYAKLKELGALTANAITTQWLLRTQQLILVR
ncbi:uncharacterized protein Z519_01843 [Cladophialophora bantiana CBS 173.52]|uniref:gluconokinase n=1 Tax=Cladophialophora bantiana (strain ATCC 10958 / CBS 173.52 / CDC B-1940 / NIH 8579) TaxID=1442370 RepID=A0A0D2IN86_CLAB1|nr:uncharacterized protein Z519_01843 [Cladophialophora bantiana CBS 173.52]KIW98259.1 hypothetical protein Z519_01843 [Cladophialophora bantiana CBS 173.52]